MFPVQFEVGKKIEETRAEEGCGAARERGE